MAEARVGTDDLSFDVLWEYQEAVSSLSSDQLLHLSNCRRCLASLAVAYMSTSKQDFEQRMIDQRER